MNEIHHYSPQRSTTGKVEGSEPPGMGLVRDGTSCGDNLVCLFEPLAKFRFPVVHVTARRYDKTDYAKFRAARTGWVFVAKRTCLLSIYAPVLATTGTERCKKSRKLRCTARLDLRVSDLRKPDMHESLPAYRQGQMSQQSQ